MFLQNKLDQNHLETGISFLFPSNLKLCVLLKDVDRSIDIEHDKITRMPIVSSRAPSGQRLNPSSLIF